jgi:hypothetical protein
MYLHICSTTYTYVHIYGQSYTYQPCLHLGSWEGSTVDGLTAMEIFMAYLESAKQLYFAQ